MKAKARWLARFAPLGFRRERDDGIAWFPRSGGNRAASRCRSDAAALSKPTLLVLVLLLALAVALLAAPAGSASDTCPNADFRIGVAASLPDCRAYEQMSPVDKGGADVVPPADAVAVDGDSVAWPSRGSFAGQQSNSGLFVNEYLSSRGGSGWSTQGIEPPIINPRTFSAFSEYVGWSADLRHMVVEAKTEDEPQNIYLRNPDGSLTLVNPGAPVVTSGGDIETHYEGASPDFSHILFFDPNAGTTQEWVNGSISPAPTTVVSSQCTTGRVGQSGPGGNCSTGSVSLARTKFVNDGFLTSFAYFTSRLELTNDANTGTSNLGTDLYKYDAQTGELTDLSPDSNPADANGAKVPGSFGAMLGASADGSYAYFVANGALASGASPVTCGFTSGNCNLYVWHDGTITFIATLLGTDNTDWSSKSNSRITSAQVSADGAHLLFTSAAQLSSSWPAGYSNAGHNEIYTYDAGSEKLTCVSCDPSGAPATGEAQLSQSQLTGTTTFPVQVNVSADGGRAFFESADALLPEDTNGDVGCPLVPAGSGQPSCLDVYEWEADGTGSCQDNGGCLYLISTGQSDSPSFFEGASASGNDVFFATRDQLVGQDTDGGTRDVYDARVDGGLASQSPPPPCMGDQCRGAASLLPSAPTAASGTFTGEGNLSPAAKARILTRVAHGATFFVRVRVPAKGRVTITGRGIGRISRVVRQAGTYRLKVRLAASERSKLKRRHKLKLELQVGFAPAGGAASSATVRLTVKQAVRRRHGRRARHELGGAK